MTRLLVAGIGNIFFGDDAFGVEVARRLARHPLPAGVRVADYGIRGLDLAYALLDGWDGAILVDALQRGGPPGTLYVLEPEPDGPADAAPDAHGMHPARVLEMVRAMGGRWPWLRVLGCEPATFGSEDDPAMGLSAPVAAAVDEAVRLAAALAEEFCRRGTGEAG